MFNLTLYCVPGRLWSWGRWRLLGAERNILLSGRERVCKGSNIPAHLGLVVQSKFSLTKSLVRVCKSTYTNKIKLALQKLLIFFWAKKKKKKKRKLAVFSCRKYSKNLLSCYLMKSLVLNNHRHTVILGPVVQSNISLTSSLSGQLVKCFRNL